MSLDDWDDRGRNPNERVTVEARKVGGTADAIRVEVDGDEHWLPLSEVGVEKIGGRFSDRVRVDMPSWLAESRGIDTGDGP